MEFRTWNVVNDFYLAQAENRQKTSHFKTIDYLENQLKSNFALLAEYEKKKDEYKQLIYVKAFLYTVNPWIFTSINFSEFLKICEI